MNTQLNYCIPTCTAPELYTQNTHVKRHACCNIECSYVSPWRYMPWSSAVHWVHKIEVLIHNVAIGLPFLKFSQFSYVYLTWCMTVPVVYHCPCYYSYICQKQAWTRVDNSLITTSLRPFWELCSSISHEKIQCIICTSRSRCMGAPQSPM